MRKSMGALLVFFCMSLGNSLLAQEDHPPQKPPNIFAQKLADEFTAKYVRLIGIGMHAKPPNGTDYVIVAHVPVYAIGNKSTATDLEVLRSGKPREPKDEGAGIYDCIVPLYDRSGTTIGVVSLHVKPDGNSKAKAQELANEIRDGLQKEIPSSAKLFEPTE